MSSEIPALPNEAPDDLEIDQEAQRSGPLKPPLAAPVRESPQPAEPPAAEAEPAAETQPKPPDDHGQAPAAAAPAATKAPDPPAPPAKPAPPRQTAPPEPAAPAMPAMPAAPIAGEDDFDDEEIPDEEEFARLIDSQDYTATDEDEEPQGLLKGVIVSVREDGAFVDVGEKSEAFLPLAGSKRTKKPDWQPGDEIDVTVSGRAADGYLLLSSVESTRPGEWSEIEVAYAGGAIVVGKVLEVVKGGLAVHVGVRGFLPASRSGERDQESLEALVGQEIRCRIAQLDIGPAATEDG